MGGTKGAGVICWTPTGEKQIEIVTNMADEEFEKALSVASTVDSVNHNEQIALVERNYNRLRGYRHFYNHTLTEGLLNTSVKSRAAGSNLASEVLNWLTSTRLLRDHAKAQFSRTYGEDSEELSKLLKLLSAEFDSNFSYRFLEKLRDYTQHIGFPVSKVQVSADDPNEVGAGTHVQFILDRDQLLSAFRWGAIVTPGLKQMPRDIDVLAVIDEGMPSWRRIYAHIFSVRARHAQRDAAEVQRLAQAALKDASPLEDAVCAPYLIDLGDVSMEAGAETISLRQIPVELANAVLDEERIAEANADFRTGAYAEKTNSPLDVSDDDREVTAIGVGLMGIFLEDGTSARFDEAVHSYAKAHDSLKPVVYGLVRIAGIALYMAGASIGTSAEAILGGLSIGHKDTSETEQK